MRVSDRMTKNPATVAPSDTLAKAKALMDAGGFRRLPVFEKDRLVGIITERDLRQHSGYLDTTRVSGGMTASPITVTPNTSIEDAARLMLQHRIGGMPVVENDQLVGVITATDLIRALLDVIQASREIMND